MAWTRSRWRFLPVLFGTVFLSSLLSAAPALLCERQERDFGKVIDQDKVGAAFLLRNTGDSPLFIERVRTSCGCTTAELESKQVLAGQSTRLIVSFDLTGRTGKQTQTVFVMSNDPANPRLLLTLRGEVRRGVEVVPQGVRFRTVIGDKIEPREVVIQSGGGGDVDLVDIDTANAAFCKVKTTRDKKGRRYVLKITPKSAALRAAGRHRGEIVAKTNHPKYSQVKIRVALEVLRDIAAIPSELPVVPLPAGRTGSAPRFVLLRSRNKNPFKIIGISRPLSGIQVQTQKRQEWEYMIRIMNLRANREVDGKSFRILVRPSAGDEYSIDVPVRVQGEWP